MQTHRRGLITKIFIIDVSCEECSGWIQFLRNLSQQLKDTGLDDVGIGTVDCLTNRDVCEQVYSNESKSNYNL